MSSTFVIELVVALTIGLLPTISMLSLSLLAMRCYPNTSEIFESVTQNLCAGHQCNLWLIINIDESGLIMGAVAKELFPQISSDSNNTNIFIGVSIGFTIALAFFAGSIL